MDTMLTLDEWLTETESKRAQLYEFGKSSMSGGSEEMDAAIQNHDDARRLLADGELYLTQETARAVLAVREDFPDLRADECRIMVKDRVKGLQRVVDGISVTVGTIRSRIFSYMNANRSHP